MAKTKGEWKPIGSTCLGQTRYNPATQQLDVQFAAGGRRYRYAGVTPTKAAGVRRASSPGGYFSRNIRNAHPVRRIPGAR